MEGGGGGEEEKEKEEEEEECVNDLQSRASSPLPPCTTAL